MYHFYDRAVLGPFIRLMHVINIHVSINVNVSVGRSAASSKHPFTTQLYWPFYLKTKTKTKNSERK